MEVSVPWRESSVADQRLEFVRLAQQGTISFAELCRRYGVKRDTGYKWLARYQQEGPGGLHDRSHKPLRSPNRTDPGTEELVCEVRRAHPAWGGRKIRGFLLRQGHTQVPAGSTITQILRRNDLMATATAQPRAYQRFETDAPNALWQMDFKGWVSVATGDRVHPFGLLDDHSRFNLSLRASTDQQTPTVKGYLAEVFSVYGLPDRILCDNGSPWGNTVGQPWNPLTVWFADLGIATSHIRPFHPQTQGKEERFHRTLDLEVISTKARWDTVGQLQGAFDDFRTLYNHHRPHQSLGETVVPADRYRPSPRTMPATLPELSFPQGSQVRKVTERADISFKGKRIRVGKPFRGLHVGVRPTTTDGVFDIYYRHRKVKTFDLSTISPNARP